MGRSKGTVSAIKALGYPSGSCVSWCRCDELPCPLLTWLSVELRTLCPELQDPDRTTDVLLVKELRHLLSSMSSPLAVMTSDVLEPSVLNNVTEFLVSELLAARIMTHKESHPEENLGKEEFAKEECAKEQRLEEDRSREVGDFSLEYEDTDAAEASRQTAEMQTEWVLLLHSLGLGASSQFDDVKDEVKMRIDRLPGGEMTNSLLKPILSSEQWREVKKINQVLLEDYGCRRQMTIKRFQVTLQSFAWGEKQKERSAALASVPPLVSLAGSSQVSLSYLLVAREDQSFIQPIKAGKSTPVYKMLMGSVPDRGGRPGEIEPPMPVWEKRRAQGNRGGRGGGHHHKHKKKGKNE